MGTTMISDKYGNRIKVSTENGNLNQILSIPENKKNISDRPMTINAIIGISTSNKGQNIESSKNENNNENKTILHICTKNSTYCREKEDGTMWLYVGTYKIKINFCPFCGYKK